MRILIADDDKEICEDLGKFIESLNHNVTMAFDGIEALNLIRSKQYDLILSDVTMPGLNGIELVKSVKDINKEIPIILISGMEDIIQSINAMDLGISDFFTKPIDLTKLSEVLQNLQKNKNLESNKTDFIDNYNKEFLNITDFKFSENYSFYKENVGSIGIFSEKIASIFKKLKKLQEYPDIPVLIEGETGTGKEIIAKYIHYDSFMEGPFIGINCSALPRELFEAELFGYEKGAFTGADLKGRDGKIKLAEKGTLFLDEISEIPLELQVKLLRVIQEREYYKIGGNKKYEVNTRISCATNRDLKKMVEKGLFREDLYFRLNICQVNIPPLRERKEEIFPLAVFFIQEFNKRMNRNFQVVETAAVKFMENYDWPGNIRELKNLLNKIMIFSEEDRLLLKDLRQNISGERVRSKKMNLFLNNFDLPDEPFNLDDFIDKIVKKTINKFNGNKTKAADFLGLSRIQLYRRFK